MFFIKTHAFTVFLIFQLITGYELKSVLNLDAKKNDVEELEEKANIETHEENLKNQKPIYKKEDSLIEDTYEDDIDNAKSEEISNPSDNKDIQGEIILKNKVDNINDIGIPSYNNSANKLMGPVSKDKKKTNIQIIMDKMKSKTKTMSSPSAASDYNDFSLDDFWVDQPFDIYNYFQYQDAYDYFKDNSQNIDSSSGSQDYSPDQDKLLLKYLDTLNKNDLDTLNNNEQYPFEGRSLRFNIDLKKSQGDSDWIRFPGIKIVDGELYFNGFNVRKISRMDEKESDLGSTMENNNKEYVQNMMGIIPPKVMSKPNSKQSGSVLENLKLKFLGKPVIPSFPRNADTTIKKKSRQNGLMNNWTQLPGTKIVNNQLYVNRNTFGKVINLNLLEKMEKNIAGMRLM